MSTIGSPDIISTILANNGQYPGDPPCYSVLAYINDWGKQTWAITFSAPDEARYFTSPSVHSPIFLFTDGKLTEDGALHLTLYPPEATISD